MAAYTAFLNHRKQVLIQLILALPVILQEPLLSQPAPVPSPRHVFFRIEAGSSLPPNSSGRLLIFLKQGHGDTEVGMGEFQGELSWGVAAREVQNLSPGASVEIDADETVFPKAFSGMPPGDYEAQAVLDTDHTYNYGGRKPNDWISSVIPLPGWTPGAGVEPSLVLDRHPPASERRAAMLSKANAKARTGAAQKEEFVSPSLSQFWGHPVTIRAWVVLPPGYNASARYPTVYWTHGFGANLDYCLTEGIDVRERMERGKIPPLIWVMLDESIPEGTHEFADSVNNGPWGIALTTEFLPYLERKYRMDARRDGRFLNGHSSGGWATLQLEINYPKIFGGTWSTSPDPSDFHDFTGPDLYSPDANVYRKPDGTPWPIMRQSGKVIATMEQFAKLEAVLGPYGGQMSSFDWVFSPKGPSGAPEPMFDRPSGAVNSKVVAYWRDHYDLAHIVEANWASRAADLKGRIHLFVGTADTFYLDGSAHRFEAVLNRLGADPHFTYLPDKTHFDLYAVGEDKLGLFDRIASEMYRVARPHKH
ncbi:MAG: enterochelin esterase [Acidobacteriaceae bacterium]|nr:enterochelin esterase [Acidobacteriaceae bacterium]